MKFRFIFGKTTKKESKEDFYIAMRIKRYIYYRIRYYMEYLLEYEIINRESP